MIDPKEFYEESGEITPEAWEGLNSDKDMEPHELRIGNIIAFEDGSTDIVRVAGIRRMAEYPETWIVDWDKISGNGSFDNGNSVVQEFIGVPLTPDILEACGFKKTTEGGDNFCDEYLNNPVHIFFDSEDFWFGFDAGPKLRRNFAIASVHQLQNLFFALTGTELTVNLDKVKV